MPQSTEPPDDAWIEIDPAKTPDEPLAPEEISAFLDWLFADVAQRPEPLRLLETARAVRLLRTLAAVGVPKALAKEEQAAVDAYRGDAAERARRERLNRLGERLWSTLLQSGEITTGKPGETKLLLKRLRESYLAETPEEVDLALELIDELTIPEGVEAFAPPRLRSSTLSFQGPAQGRHTDDVSERIYAAYYVLQEAKRPRRALEIAEALKRYGIARKRSPQSDWIAGNVADLVKSHERSLLTREAKKGPGAASRPELRKRAASRWKMLFGAARAYGPKPGSDD